MTSVEADAAEAAKERVRQQLRFPEHLAKVSQLREEMQKKKTAVDSQLKAVLQTQMNDARAASHQLDYARKEMAEMKRSFASIVQWAGETRDMLTEYQLIKQVNVARRNLLAVQSMRDSILDIPALVEDLFEALKDDEIFEGNVLDVHRSVRELQERRDDMVHQAKEHPECQHFLADQLAAVDEVTSQFERQIWRCIHDTLELSVESPAVLVKVLRVIEEEEKLDQEAMDEGSSLYRHRNPRGYFGECLEHLRASVEARFKEQLPFIYGNVNVNGNGDGNEGMGEGEPDVTGDTLVAQFLGASEFILSDIETVLDEVIQRFPPRYNILVFYAKEYHRRMYNALKTMVSKGIKSPKEILDLIRWVRDITRKIGRLSVPTEVLQPPLINTLDPLYVFYLNAARENMRTWVENMVNVDTEQQLAEIGDKWYSLVNSDLFESVFGQIQLASDVDNGIFLLSVVRECLVAMRSYQNKIIARLSGPKSASLSFQYLCAQINSGSQSVSQMSDFNRNVAKLLSAEYAGIWEDDDDDDDVDAAGDAHVAEEDNGDGTDTGSSTAAARANEVRMEADAVSSGFMAVSKAGVGAMCRVIYDEASDPFPALFEKEWLMPASDDGGPIDAVLSTLDAYFNDIEPQIDEYFFKKLVDEVLNWTLSQYLNQLVNVKHAPVSDKSEVADTMRSDLLKLQEFFKNFARDKFVTDCVRKLDPFALMIEADPESVCIYYGILIKEKLPMLRPDHVEAIISRRVDFDKRTIKDAVASCVALYETELAQRENGTSSNTGSVHALLAKVLTK